MPLVLAGIDKLTLDQGCQRPFMRGLRSRCLRHSRRRPVGLRSTKFLVAREKKTSGTRGKGQRVWKHSFSCDAEEDWNYSSSIDPLSGRLSGQEKWRRVWEPKNECSGERWGKKGSFLLQYPFPTPSSLFHSRHFSRALQLSFAFLVRLQRMNIQV